MEFDTDGTPIWRARRLMLLMGYPRWADFQRVMTRAMSAAKNTEMEVAEVFRRSPENPGENGGRPREDFKLTRDAAYLTALNGDPNKDEVAGAQRYFVEQTKRQEAVQRQAPPAAAPVAPIDDLALLEGLIQVVRANRQQVAAIQAAQLRQAEEQRVLAARVDGIEGNHDFFAALAYAKMNGISTETRYLARLGTVAARITRRMGFAPGKAPHALYGTVNTYPIAALDEALEVLGGAA